MVYVTFRQGMITETLSLSAVIKIMTSIISILTIGTGSRMFTIVKATTVSTVLYDLRENAIHCYLLKSNTETDLPPTLISQKQRIFSTFQLNLNHIFPEIKINFSGQDFPFPSPVLTFSFFGYATVVSSLEVAWYLKRCSAKSCIQSLRHLLRCKVLPILCGRLTGGDVEDHVI